MDFMSYQVPLYQPAFPQHDAPIYSQDLHSYADSQHLHSYHMPRRSTSMNGIRQVVTSHGEKNETKPRLAKDEVEILENHFRACNKPNSQLKRELAEQFGVEPARINNWFQNRRAKAKQERKQLDYDLRQTGDMTYSRPHSADGYGDEAFDEHFEAPMPQSAQIPILGGPPPAPVASFHPRYDNPSAASMHSLQRTIQEAEAAAIRGDFDDFPSQVSDASFGESLYTQHFSATDRVQFPTMNSAVNMRFDEQVFESENPQSMQATASQSQVVEAMRRPFPPQMLDNNGLPAITYQSHVLMPVPQANDMGSEDSDMRFKSPPPPTDLAGRRSKPRPAALGSMSLREHIGMGPRSVSSNDVPKRMNYSPLGSPMRRIQSNGGGLNVIGGRIQKVVQSQRSPLAKTFAPNYDAFLQDYTTRSLGPVPNTAGTCLGQEFPPTPSSPYAKSQIAHSISDASSPVRSEPSYIFNTTGFDMADQMSNIASPPETPQNAVASSQWGFDVTDDALHTPVFGIFGPDASMSISQPQYVSPMSTSVSASQPATPALGSFNGYMFQASSPQFEFSADQQAVEYHFPDGSGLPYGIVTSNRSSPVSHLMSKNYTFSNMTAESLKEQQKKGDDREKTPVSKSRD